MAGSLVTGFLLAFVPLGIGTFNLARARYLKRDYLQFMREGVPVQAHVIEKWGGNWSRHSYLRYRYDYEGKTYSGEQEVEVAYYQNCEKGTPIPIRCRSSNPAISRIEGVYSDLGDILGGICCVGLGIFVLAIMLVVTFGNVSSHP